MVDRFDRHQGETLVLGLLLVGGGITAFLAQSLGVDLGTLIGEGGWPYLVIVPGLVLLLGALVVPRPGGVGFAVAGSIVTTVGAILLYQNATDTFESWAYVWALIPTAAGVALTISGLATGTEALVRTGSRMAVVGTVLFLAGLWFFGSLFSTGEIPIDLGTWWPVAFIVVGGAVVLSAFGGSDPTAHHGQPRGG